MKSFLKVSLTVLATSVLSNVAFAQSNSQSLFPAANPPIMGSGAATALPNPGIQGIMSPKAPSPTSATPASAQTATPAPTPVAVTPPPSFPAAPAPLPPQTIDMSAVPVQTLLNSLSVNTPAQPMPVRQIQDIKSVTLKAGINSIIELPIGAARTINLPVTFNRVTIVIPEVVDVIPLNANSVQLMARQAGSTDIVFTNTDTGQNYRAHITSVLDIIPIQQAIDVATTGEHIVVKGVNKSIILTGTTRDPIVASTALAIAQRYVADPTSIVNQIQVLGGQQVMLRVRIAEVNRTVSKSLGINSTIDATRKAANGGTQGGIFGSSLSNAAGTALAATNPVGLLSTKVLGAVFTSTLSALESEGLVKTLAEPNLVAISGKTANFLSGFEYPVPTVSGTSGAVGAEYRAFGISLSFSPTVLSPTNIGLLIATEVSAQGENVSFPIGQTTTNLPTFTVRRANTTVELPSGGSIAIAGMISSDFQDTIAGTPGIKNVPILGKLFSSTDFRRHESELVIMVTAYLVEPTDGTQKLSSPGDGLMPPSDADIYLLNHLTGIMNRRPTTPPPSVARDVGYITE